MPLQILFVRYLLSTVITYNLSLSTVHLSVADQGTLTCKSCRAQLTDIGFFSCMLPHVGIIVVLRFWNVAASLTLVHQPKLCVGKEMLLEGCWQLKTPFTFLTLIFSDALVGKGYVIFKCLFTGIGFSTLFTLMDNRHILCFPPLHLLGDFCAGFNFHPS